MTDQADGSDLRGVVLRAWQDVLGTTEFGPDDDFFRLGGDSLRLALLVHRLKEETGIGEVALLGAFQDPTVNGHCRLFEDARP